jgi:AcrR family transcriptional regulator
MEAALALLQRDGVLAGLSLQEVADEARVNRGLIHHYFKDRQTLIRAALNRLIESAGPVHDSWRRREPEQKRLMQFRNFVKNQTYPRMSALLALDGDESFTPVPFVHERLEDFERERAEGLFRSDVDGIAELVAWESLVLGYVLIRDGAARQLGVSSADLDRRVQGHLARMLSGLTGSPAGS